MALVAGINHISIITPDLDRLSAFYCDTFEAQIVQLQPTPFGGRVCILRIGNGTALNLFEVPASAHPPVPVGRFQRGPLDHFGFAASCAESFWELRARLMTDGRSTGEVTDFGPIIGIDFADPDGGTVELALVIDPSLLGGHRPVPYCPPVHDSSAPL